MTLTKSHNKYTPSGFHLLMLAQQKKTGGSIIIALAHKIIREDIGFRFNYN
jgi:hypothetical protein